MSAATKFRVAAVAIVLLTGCGESDPGALGPSGVDGSLSPEGQKQVYVDGVSRALDQLGSTQGAGFAKAVDGGNKQLLQTAALAWRQGGDQLKSLDPPKGAADEHQALIKAVDALDTWNKRLVAAAPNKASTRKIAKAASNSPASRQFEAAVCALNDAGYEVVDPGACTPLSNAAGPVG